MNKDNAIKAYLEVLGFKEDVSGVGYAKKDEVEGTTLTTKVFVAEGDEGSTYLKWFFSAEWSDKGMHIALAHKARKYAKRFESLNEDLAEGIEEDIDEEEDE